VLWIHISIVPALKIGQMGHPVLRIKFGHRSQMIRDSAHLVSEECRYGRERRLDINLISLEFFDALCKKLVVVDKWPQVPIP
jgi:hypothetical protein